MSIANQYEWQMLALINAERALVGAAPLRLETTLNRAAEDHSTWMLQFDTFSHTGVGGSNPGLRIEYAGFDFSGDAGWAENLAGRTISSPDGYFDEILALHQQLMNSPGHRANILDPEQKYIGIGLEIGEYQGRTWAMVTQKFAHTQGQTNLDTTNIENYEVQFDSDFNGDGTIGHTLIAIDTVGIGLQASTEHGYLITDGADTLVVTLNGVAARPDSFEGWSALEAGSDGAGGYSVLWQHQSGTYGVWNVDASGALYEIADVTNLIDYEDRFEFDFNNDGTIGHTLVDLDTVGIGLQASTEHGYLITDGADTLVVTLNGVAARPDSFEGWSALEAGSDGAGGYSVLWQHQSGTYGVWNLDALGAQYEIADVTNLIDYEDRFEFDFNNDDTIGHTLVDLDTVGIGLQASTEHGYLITDGADTLVVTLNGVAARPDSFEGWSALEAGSDGAGGYSVLWQHQSGTYGVWNVDALGALYEFADVTNLVDYEDRFQVDFNGDFVIA